MTVALHLLLVFAVLCAAALASRRGGLALLGALFALAFGVGSLNLLIEAWAFGVSTAAETARFLVGGLVNSAVLAVAAVVLTGRWRAGGEPTSRPCLTPARLAGVIAAYVTLYLAAGALVFPYVADFYATRRLPPMAQIVPLQVGRALIFVAVVWPLLRLRPRAPSLLTGVALSVIGGLAPLAVDNPLMPAAVRGAHAIEVGISNFLFGLILAWLLRPRTAAAGAQAAPAAA